MNNQEIKIVVAVSIIIVVCIVVIIIGFKPTDTKKEYEKSNEERILNSLQKIEKHTFGIKIGIFMILIYAILLRNLIKGLL
jgi:hypothetical protein